MWSISLVTDERTRERGTAAGATLSAVNIAFFFPFPVIELAHKDNLTYAMAPGPLEGSEGEMEGTAAV